METDASVDDNVGHHDDADGQRINTWVGVGNPAVPNGMVAIAVDFAGWSESPLLDANVSLIAAAPELYEALAATENALANVPPNSGIGFSEWLDDIRASIRPILAKARGGA